MKDERLYINGELVDIGTDTKITMNIKSNLFRDVSKIASNSTYTVKLPKTVRNQMLLQHADLVQSKDGYPYVTHRAQYFRNGVEVISNGRVTVLKVSEDSIEISILWGLFPNFSKMLSEGATLNQLKSDDVIMFNSANTPISYIESTINNYFYAGYDVWKKEKAVDYTWGAGSRMIFPEEETSESSYSGHYGKGKGSGDSVYYLHPVAKAAWVLRLIKENKGIDFQFTGEAKQYINSLVIPLISKKSNELTFRNSFKAEMKPTDEKGSLSLWITEDNNVFEGSTGAVVQSLSVKSDANVIFDIKGRWQFDITGHKPTGYSGAGSFGGSSAATYDDHMFKYGYWLKMRIVNGANVEEYVFGKDGEHFRVTVPSGYQGVCRFEYSGYGKIEVKAGSIVNFEWLSDGSLKDAKFLGGTIKATLSAGETVPSGGFFPIASNLPNVKIIDFVKFLAAITGTFPLQLSQDGVVKFVPLSTVWNNKAEAKDWTRRLIAQGAENKPKEIEFVFNDYAQHNLYKWKEDDTVLGKYNGDLRVNNDTLEVEKVVFEFPFAATDGDNVPMYGSGKAGEKELVGDVTIGEKEGKPKGGGSGGAAGDSEPPYSACKDRILRLRSGENGKAQAFFDINMQDIINTKYRNISDSLQRAKIITEKIRISDLELIGFDETKPVYLAQYGSYFAVTEIKADDNGIADVTMLQLYFNI